MGLDRSRATWTCASGEASGVSLVEDDILYIFASHKN